MPFIAAHADGKNIVTLSGELTVSCAEELKKKLLEAIGTADALSVKFDAVTDIDLSFLQVLCAAHRSAVNMNKTLSFAGNPPLIVKTTASNAGYTRLKECAQNVGKSCLWQSME